MEAVRIGEAALRIYRQKHAAAPQRAAARAAIAGVTWTLGNIYLQRASFDEGLALADAVLNEIGVADDEPTARVLLLRAGTRLALTNDEDEHRRSRMRILRIAMVSHRELLTIRDYPLRFMVAEPGLLADVDEMLVRRLATEQRKWPTVVGVRQPPRCKPSVRAAPRRSRSLPSGCSGPPRLTACANSPPGQTTCAARQRCSRAMTTSPS